MRRPEKPVVGLSKPILLRFGLVKAGRFTKGCSKDCGRAEFVRARSAQKICERIIKPADIGARKVPTRHGAEFRPTGQRNYTLN